MAYPNVAGVPSYSGTFIPEVWSSKLIEKYSAGILAHWDGHLTNAYLEGLNSVFSAVKRRARGYRTSRYLIAMLYFVAGKLPDPKPLFH